MEIECNRLDRGFQLYQGEFERKALEVLRSGWYILGPELQSFEKEFAAYAGTAYCVGVGCGLDALTLAFRVLGIHAGDEVIVQGNAYIASVMGITLNGGTPVFVEPNRFNNIDVAKIEEAITPKTKAILVVHLYGQASKMDAVMELAERYGLKVVEDCAQSHGAKYGGRMTGSFGDVGCFSFYPTKNLGAFGDGGAVTTDNPQIAEQVRILRNYGSEKKYHNKVVGVNSRLDELQAGLLRVRLKHLEELIAERRRICDFYSRNLKNGAIEKPAVEQNATTVWHQYVVRCAQRDRLRDYLQKNGIHTLIHYPIPPHLSEAYRYLNVPVGSLPVTERYAAQVLSLPLYNGMTQEEQKDVVDAINGFHA